jgi:hypothetical protein
VRAVGLIGPIGLVSLAVACSCGPTSSETRRERKETSMALFRGIVKVDGAPARGEVMLVDPAGKVVASTTIDEQGGYRAAPPQGFTGGWLLARVYRPVAGARALAIDGEGGERNVELTSKEAITLSGDLRFPAGVTPDWVQVDLTPRALDGVPPAISRALVAVDTGPAIKGVYRADVIRGSRFSASLLPGTWDLVVARMVEVSPGHPLTTPNLINATLTLPDGSQPSQTFGGYRLVLRRDLHVVVELVTTE